MILGQAVPQFRRYPFTPPGRPVPQLAPTLFESNFAPFSPRVMAQTPSLMPYRPPYPGPMQIKPRVPMMPTPPPAPAPAPGPTAGAFGAAPMHMHVSPYKTGVVGWIPGIASSGANVRAGAYNAGRLVQSISPAGTRANRVAATY